ncbi:MAG: SDR family oxidoreductase [Deltaproteobacteria bacterium]|nr:SDR family oxidoreductase [Deltaproteobacteria bacterium]
MSLVGKTALVTGAAKRLGRGVALTLAEAGAEVILHVNSSLGDDVARAIREIGGHAAVVRGDLSRTDETLRVAREARALARDGKIDILVNNAAVFTPLPLARTSLSEWQRMVRVNLTAPFIFALTLGRAMHEAGSGKIIQLGDWSGQRPVPGYVPYCVSKGGLHVLTVALAKALAPRVQVNEVVLGPVLLPDEYDEQDTQVLLQQIPLRRVGSVAGVVRTVRFFAEASEFITGASYAVDGGLLANVPGGSNSL